MQVIALIYVDTLIHLGLNFIIKISQNLDNTYLKELNYNDKSKNNEKANYKKKPCNQLNSIGISFDLVKR